MMNDLENPESKARTSCREDRRELRRVPFVVGQTITTSDTEIPRAEKYTRSPHAQQSVTVAYGLSIVPWNSLLIVPV
jgi:hypothetical protein